MLSVVIGIVTQSAAKEPDMRVFAEHLLDRLHALAGTYALISRENWGPVRLDELVRRELEPYALDENRRRVAVDGIAVSLGPKAALAFGMALHELATNAATFGSLTESTGRVEVSWSIEGEGNGAGRRLVVRWREVDGPAVPRKRREGFGTALLGRVLNYEVDGEVSVEFAPDGLRAQLVAPVDGDLVRIGDDSGAGTTPRPPA
jgi:two-component system CheB/CheR fusion protein